MFYSEDGDTLEQVAQKGGQYPSLETFQARLDRAPRNLM